MSNYRKSLKVYEPPECFKDGFDSFINSLKPRSLKEATIYKYRRDCTFMLTSFFENGITQWCDITLQTVTDAFKHSNNKPSFRTSARLFFAHLVKIGLAHSNFGDVLPVARRAQKVPSLFSKDEIELLLNSINRDTTKGKRDYAVILLALRLGLRNSDIRMLTFDNVDFDNRFIDFTQYKTSVHHRLNIPNDVKNALADYINNARPESEEPYIFLGSKLPYSPLTGSGITAIVTNCFKKAGIESNGRHLGPHALRSTFASELLAEKVPYDAIRVILGHTDPGSTRFYTKMSIEDLRTCALAVPPPSGLFAEYLKGVGI